MADAKLSALALFGTTPDLIYGEEGGVSKKYSGLKIYNVVDFGADPTGTNDSASAIQTAVNTASSGGIIFFPVGLFKVISAPIVFNFNSSACLRIVGCGAVNGNGGTRITTPSNIYIFYCHNTGGQGGAQPIESIEHISFTNSYNPGAHGTITSTELVGGGFGCVYHTAGWAVTINSCSFNCVSGGIALFANVIGLAVNSCNFQGPFSGTHAEDSYGIIANNLSISDLHLVAFGVGITSSAPGLVSWLQLNGADIEVCGCAIRLGYIPIAQWDPFQNATATGNGIATAHIRNVDLESNGDSDGSSNAAGNSVAAVIDIYQTQACILENIKSQNIQFSQANGIAIWNVSGLFLNNVQIAGGGSFGYTTAAINFRNAGDTTCINVFAGAGSFGGHGVDWSLPSGGTGRKGISFDGCSQTSGLFDGAMTLASLPSFTNFGARMVISDSTVVAAGNFGANIVGGGTHKVVGQSDGGANWTIVG